MSLPLRFQATAFGFAVLLAAGVAGAADQAPPDLWNGAVVGMNIDQVDARFPQAVATSGQSLEDGSQAALTVPAELGGAKADAFFFFRGNSLSAILVESHAVHSGRRADNLIEARRIVAAATSQYGPPKRCIDRPGLAALDCVWTLGALKVSVGYHDIGGGSPALSALYTRAP